MSRPVLLFLAAVLAACAPARRVLEGPPKRTEFEQERYEQAIREGRVLLGMTESEVRRTRGEPVRKDIVRRFGGVKVRRWVYPFDEVYFDAKGLVVGTYAAYR